MIRRVRPLTDWPEAIELVILAIRSGAAPLAAIEDAARHSSDEIAAAFDEVVHRMHRGMRLADALSALPERLGPETADFADSIANASRYGLPLEPVLDRLANDARNERRRRADVDARALPVKLSFPLVVCTLPSFVLLGVVPAVLGALATLRGSVP